MDIDRKTSGTILTRLSKFILVLTGVLAGVLAIRIYFTAFTVSDDTMAPNFMAGDKIYILRHVGPRIGDVVLMDSPIEEDRALLKRVVAAEGDTVEVKNGLIFINGRPAEFQWNTQKKDIRIFPMSFSTRDNFPIIKLKRKEYFVLGDNLDYAMDSRFFGVVTRDRIIGRYIYSVPFMKK